MPFFNKLGGGSARKFGLSRAAKGPVTVEFLVLGGGGGGGYQYSGGGGGGGYRTSVGTSGAGASAEANLVCPSSTPLTVTVGAGGAWSGSYTGAQGGNSTFHTITALGGGGGRNGTQTAGLHGSGAGGSNDQPNWAGGAGTTGQGYGGGSGFSSPGHWMNIAGVAAYSGGGGGGSGGGGGGSYPTHDGTYYFNGDYDVPRYRGTGGDGGGGISSSITGSSVTRGGGGGGSNYIGSGWRRGAGGSGGGGGASSAGGGTNLGGGGGAGPGYWPNRSSGPLYNDAGNGGSGVVIVRWLTTAGAVPSVSAGLSWSYSNSGSYTCIIFSSGSGNLTLN